KGKLNAAREDLGKVFKEAGKDMNLAEVKSLSGDSNDKLAWIRSKNEEIEALASDVKKLDELYGIATKRAEDREQHEEKGYVRAERKSLGDQFAESAALKGWRRGVRETPMASLDLDVKALMSRDAGFAPESTRTGRVVDFATRPAPQVVHAIPSTSTGQSEIVYMEETTFGNAAFEVDEAGEYPESTLIYTERRQPVRKVATYMSVTDEQLEDESNARDRINNRLPLMIAQRVDRQVLLGTGTSVSSGAIQLLGTTNVSGIQTQAQGGDNVLDALHKAFTKIRTVGEAEPSVVYINPSDWEIIELMKTADGQYMWGAPSGTGPRTVWGVPVLTTQVLTAGTAVTGDYANYAELALR